ncbi:hypothetical protein [Pectobacterium sp. CHL-2024]|uniref:hypothetical protein n=1 Tax=Pectobacterium sp. CHL-2024 TaxID=3377079 RepID=UPI0037F1C642
MNTLLFALIGALRSHRWLRLLGFAYVLSSLGNGLTQVIIFGQLLHWQCFSCDAYHDVYAVDATQLYWQHLGRDSV